MNTTASKLQHSVTVIEIVELDDRLDMTPDPMSLFLDIEVNAKCATDSGCNRFAGCGSPKPSQS